MEFGVQLLRLAGSLALVLGLFFAFIYVLKRWGGGLKRQADPGLLEVLSKQSFGPRHHLILVKVSGERQVLVGISPQNMSLVPVDRDAPVRPAATAIENL